MILPPHSSDLPAIFHLFCSSCGHFVEKGDRYCKFCGSVLEKGSKRQLPKVPPSILRLTNNIGRRGSSNTSPHILNHLPPVLNLSDPEQKELLMRFKHMRDQIDLSNNEGELRDLLNESESLRRQSSESNRELANYEHALVAKKARTRAVYLGFRETAKYAGKVASRILVL
jgi:hypothetical protein